jgi:hypothetical protein
VGANPGVNSKDAYLIVDAASGRELASDQPTSCGIRRRSPS